MSDYTCPNGFTKFSIPSAPKQAEILNSYLWYHFSHRLGNGKTLFSKEYTIPADLWLNEAIDAKRAADIQKVHADDLLDVQIHHTGYVHVHQHQSHALDIGWPFPLWGQADVTPEKVLGKTAGWHFQEDAKDWDSAFLCPGIEGFHGRKATESWVMSDLQPNSYDGKLWSLSSTGGDPALTSPEGVPIEAFCAPFVQMRWRYEADPSGMCPWIEWMREGDTEFLPGCRMEFQAASELPEELNGLDGIIGDAELAADGLRHSIIPLHTHPLWTGRIIRLRIHLAPGCAPQQFAIDSIFTCFDTRHTINNPILISNSWMSFCWTGDEAFLRSQIDRMRFAMRYMLEDMGGGLYGYIRVPWVGHDGISGLQWNADGTKSIRSGHGIGENYWDLMPFGHDNLYINNMYHKSLLCMAEAEEYAAGLADSPQQQAAFDPDYLRAEALRVRESCDRLFWDESAGRYIAAIDAEGGRHDYGYTFLNTESVWYGVADPDKARTMMQWIAGERVVEGDTSTGADIYHWKFGPRATTKRNIEWYQFPWAYPENIDWGGQVQDGGGVLGFSFFDLWARLQLRGADDAWLRLCEICAWEEEVRADGGYRAYYADGKRGTTLQGGGTAGGLGVDFEFFESSLLPSIITYGFMGITAKADGLHIAPNLPSQCPAMSVLNLRYRGSVLNIHAEGGQVRVETVHEGPLPVVVHTGA